MRNSCFIGFSWVVTFALVLGACKPSEVDDAKKKPARTLESSAHNEKETTVEKGSSKEKPSDSVQQKPKEENVDQTLPNPDIVEKPIERDVELEVDTPALMKAEVLRFPVKEGKYLGYVSNRDLMKASHSIETLVVVVHGIDRNPEAYYSSMLNAVKAQGVSDTTWVVAPFFMQEEDKPSPNDLRWDDGNWKEGFAAKGMSGASWSSYAMLDEMLRAMNQAQRFSKLKKIYLVGFSAGGQFMQRYLVGTRIPDELKNFQFRFVIGAPGSYMYVTPERKPVGKTSFAKPTNCENFDDFRYGINKRTDYLVSSNQADMIARLVYRDVRFIAGTADTSRGGVLDVTCSADLQGANRFTRAQTYFEYVKHLNAAAQVKFFSVPNVGHEHEKIFKSSEGRKAIFED